ncbi:TonB-dependent receptor domain-containing protein [Sphingobacterium rhinopitheci]|uniref:TonB-dependent receptor domain-containing protein n=1 Tax=Sphingobacterium rhinopitheci TaxID=2781960 RepID=UPI001F52093B|nr:TonB-dependent receptor [Sphingobacterium rhinopitheci]MCI0922213.1 TonB-dependent receptor [Sphingobacterium rhinopitheci]
MKRNYLLPLLFVLLFPIILFAQDGKLKVTVVEASNEDPILGASVSLLDLKTNNQVKGRQTGQNGIAILEAINPGKYLLKISYVGLLDHTIDEVTIVANQTLDLGTIGLVEGGNQLDEVVVRGKVSDLQLGIDKKIFDVSQSMVSVGGTAQDLLGNVPTIQVDADGSISLRGSTVRILIDGKESAMAGSDINKLLQSLPADAVAKVEIITNPSAKYDAEGQSGIVNIVLKKNIRTGLNGVVNASVGSYDNYNAGVSLNYRNEKFNYFGSYNYRNGRNVGEGSVRTVELINGVQAPNSEITESNSQSFRKGINNSFRLGADYYASEKTTYSLGTNISIRDNNRGEDIVYTYFNRPSFGNKSPRTSRQQEQDFGYDITFDYKRLLKRDGEEITGNITYGNDKEDGTNEYIQTYDIPTLDESRRNNTTSERGKNWNFQLDYLLPLGENHKIEAGYRGIIRNSDENQYSERLLNGAFVTDYNVTNDFDMTSGVHAIYANYQRMLSSRIGMQFGLRAEDAYLNSTIQSYDPDRILAGTNIVAGKLDYFRVYPSLFLTYDVNAEGDKVQLSYSRRVQRPRGWQVNPFVDVSDETNFRQGNPNLLPEDIHAAELSFAKFYSKWNFITSAYFRRVNDMTQPFQYDTNDPIAAIYLGDNTNATFMRWENVGSRNNAGFELISKVNIFNWWDVTVNGNAFYFKVNPNERFDVRETDGFSWNGNLTTNVKFSKLTSLQLKGDYRAPMNTLQGKMKSMSGVDAALKQDILKGKGSLMFNVRDLFDTRRFGGESYLPARYSEFYHRWSKRTFTLSFSYRFGMQDINKNKDSREEGSFSEDAGY